MTIQDILEIADAVRWVEESYCDDPGAYCPPWARVPGDWDDRKKMCVMAERLMQMAGSITIKVEME